MSSLIARSAALALAGISLLGLAASATAQYPSRPVAVIVSGPPGGPLDVVTRTVFNKVSEDSRSSR